MADSVPLPRVGGFRWRAGLGRLLPFAGLAVVLAIWQAVTMIWAIPPYILPQPAQLVRSFGANAHILLPALGVLLIEAAAGFVIGNLFGISVAFAINQSPTVRAAVMPVAIAIRSVPMVAITPLITLMVGFGHATVLTIAAIVVFFPTMVNVSRGLRSVPKASLELFRVLDASDWTIFRKLRLPTALPYLFAALKITAPAAIVGSMLAEYVASNAGLGYLIQDSYTRYRYELVWQIVVLATSTTLLAYAALSALERKIIRWRA